MSHRLLAATTALCALASHASAQVIAVKTLPIAQGAQFDIFPSATAGMAGVSIALPDSLLDPYVNPALGARLRGMRVESAPGRYEVGSGQGGGSMLTAGTMLSHGAYFGGVLLVTQRLDSIRGIARPVFLNPQLAATGQAPFPSPSNRRTNRYAVATLGRRFGAGVSLGASVQYAGLEAVDGTELLYVGHENLDQHGHDLSARVGLLKEWEGARSFEALVVHERYAMRHDVTFAQAFWNPNVASFSVRPEVEHNGDRTNTWALKLAYARPVVDSTWRAGLSVTGNVASHPELPTYRIEEVRVIPWDPGRTTAFNLGAGVSRAIGNTTYGADAVWEPIVTHTWGDTPTPINTDDGQIIAAGGHTVDNHFEFSNSVVRAGIAQRMDHASDLQLQAGIEGHTIHYWMRQFDHVAATSRRQEERWTEWTKTWGMSVRLGRADLRYQGRLTTGAGRPGTRRDQIIAPTVDIASSAGNILTAPSGALTLAPVDVWTHRISVTLPVR